MTDSTAASIEGLVAQIREGVQLRDGYYLREELVDLYLVGVLRGMEAGLLEADPESKRKPARAQLLEQLGRTSAQLLDNLTALRSTESPQTA